MIFRFRATLWLYSGKAAWHFVTLPADISDEVEAVAAGTDKGFGSVRVQVTIGDTTWKTSLFPDTKAAAYVLPIKKQVRTIENLTAGDEIDLAIEPIHE